jgi:phosphatidylglycerol---prolipoprotein diacylglyceryl transferase
MDGRRMVLYRLDVRETLYTLKTDASMYPFIHIGGFSLGTFGLCLWLAAVCACWVLYKNIQRHGVQADAIGIVAYVTVIGVAGAKLWHVLEEPALFFGHPASLLFDRAGFAWFGGLVGGILVLYWQGRQARIGGLAMLDLASPAAAVGYGVGRIGCLVSGDGDYGTPTNLPWGMSFPHGLVPTTQRVHPTPLYELAGALLIAWFLWYRGRPRGEEGAKALPVGAITGEYLVWSGIARFFVEFIRINPRIDWGMSNAQAASLGSILAGGLLLFWARWRGRVNSECETVVVQAGSRH